jgi:stalled ribosome rescue protein Dom34
VTLTARAGAWACTVHLQLRMFSSSTNSSISSLKNHLLVWIDHKEARIFHVDAKAAFNVASVKAPTHHLHKHPRGSQEPKEHPEDAKRFFHDVVRLFEGAEAILIVGPSTAKLHLLKFVQEHAPGIASKVVGIETVDHPTDGQLIAYARTYFKATDRMTG